MARLYGLSDPGLGSIEVAACDAHVALGVTLGMAWHDEMDCCYAGILFRNDAA